MRVASDCRIETLVGGMPNDGFHTTPLFDVEMNILAASVAKFVANRISRLSGWLQLT